ncbi:MAG: endonuclease/exonuclease/phosphatase family protein [Paracoccaceae bacterium]|jgi:endonuclease/exonuclease/phosphatase family metal-dependent hydrolase|nr:endonuclease/exonuclease/phosphatase family protein [Paracoccaceae bacterium]
MRLRLASYNVQKAVGLDLRRDPARILEVINALGADVVALQEADMRLGVRPAAIPRRLLEAETDFDVVDVAENDVSLGWHGNALLVRRGLPVTAPARLPLPGLEPRGAVAARIGARIGEGEAGAITVIGVHLGLIRAWRRRQARALRDHAGRGDAERTAILGDFNEWSLQKGLGPLHPAFQIVTPGPTFPAPRPVAHLDRAALGPGLVAHDAEVANGALARVASDHLPIRLDVTATG